MLKWSWPLFFYMCKYLSVHTHRGTDTSKHESLAFTRIWCLLVQDLLPAQCGSRKVFHAWHERLAQMCKWHLPCGHHLQPIPCCIQVQSYVTSCAWLFGQIPWFQSGKEQTDPFPKKAVLNTAERQNQAEIQPIVSQTHTKKFLVWKTLFKIASKVRGYRYKL